MIVMPLGSFMMGAIPGESRNPFDIYGENATRGVRDVNEVNIIPNEHPRHSVEIDIPFAIGRNEITHAEWMHCVADGGCSHNPDHRALRPDGYVALGPTHPVVDVSYVDALEYAAWLNSLVGADVYRLPTETEWEYAARAGTATRFAQGDELTPDQANFSRASTEHLRQRQRPEGMAELVNRWQPVPVDELDAANAWGVRHMSGNVSEHTQSCWSAQHLSVSRSSAYLAISKPYQECGKTVAKGGAYTTAMDGLRPARRISPVEGYRRSFLGFRLVRVLTPAAPS
ncbi:formylglycine-generating enzyme family protein [Loktanella agnita]|uniref:formylglycine-generating enzyme family protein n=1 Tax=Loktanella agnita TaxID=287097 RepID=UPI003985D2B2